MKFLATFVAFLVALAAPSPAQVARGPGAAAIPDGLFVAGTTTLDAQGQPWAYVFITAPDMGSIAGRHFAVHLKPAAPAAAGVFALQGVAATRKGMWE